MSPLAFNPRFFSPSRGLVVTIRGQVVTTGVLVVTVEVVTSYK